MGNIYVSGSRVVHKRKIGPCDVICVLPQRSWKKKNRRIHLCPIPREADPHSSGLLSKLITYH